jgi:hypothetical protein
MTVAVGRVEGGTEIERGGRGEVFAAGPRGFPSRTADGLLPDADLATHRAHARLTTVGLR